MERRLQQRHPAGDQVPVTDRQGGRLRRLHLSARKERPGVPVDARREALGRGEAEAVRGRLWPGPVPDLVARMDGSRRAGP